MQNQSSQALRQGFLNFFQRHNHTIVKSSPLVPNNDPTLMFVNAGMVQFKGVFVGEEKRPYTRATTAQKCLRVSGKHNDLEEVGRTARHHTFFEMLGNFSFGDYFKEQAIVLAWDFISKELQLDVSRLWFTVFGGSDGIPADSEAKKLWKKVTGVSDHRIIELGMKENFWAMGDTGPCGPCSEIHFDLGGESEPTLQDFETGRVVEIWNNVFMQFNRDKNGVLNPLPAPSVDTGMGLERLTAVVQGKSSNYHTDLFLPLIQEIAGRARKPYTQSDSDDDVSIRVIADHARATAHLISDGIQPSNEGRGYVLRRIMRRAIRHGKRLGLNQLFFADACLKVVQDMHNVYPELKEAQTLIQKVAHVEEENFRRTLDTGLNLLSEAIEKTQENKQTTLSGEVVFKLYDTYGFPKDLTEVIAHEKKLDIDHEGFEQAMNKQRERSRQGENIGTAVSDVYKTLAQKLEPIVFNGYEHEDVPLNERQNKWRMHNDHLECTTSIVALLQNGKETTTLSASDTLCEIVLNPTPFYGEAGGQVGDKGVIETQDAFFEIIDTQKPVENLTVMRGYLRKGNLTLNQQVFAGYNPDVRKQTRAHHSATHLLHHALRNVLGDHVKQAGSLVDATHLRFDFSHFEAVTKEQWQKIEEQVNQAILTNASVQTEILPFDQAKQRGAVALFGEKYGDTVRVISMGNSVEFCGGTHAKNTQDLGFFLLTSEEAVSSGIRRIEAECAEQAKQSIKNYQRWLSQAAAILNGDTTPYDDNAILHTLKKSFTQYQEQLAQLKNTSIPLNVGKVSQENITAYPQAQTLRDLWYALIQLANAKLTEVEAIAEKFKAIDHQNILKTFAALQKARKDNEKLLQDKAKGNAVEIARTYAEQAHPLNDIRILATEIDNSHSLRDMAEALRQHLGSCVLCLASKNENKVSLIVAVSPDLTKRYHAGNLVQALAPLIEGRGGGKADVAQAGGNNADGLQEAFVQFNKLIATQTL